MEQDILPRINELAHIARTRPLTPEEGGVANRVEQLGAGLRLSAAAPDAIRRAVDAVLSDPKYRAAANRIGEGFRKCGGARAAAEMILAHIKS